MRADSATQEAIEAVMNEFASGYRARDLDRMMGCFIPDPDTTVIGTGPDEKRVGLAEIRAQMDRDWVQTDSAWVRYTDVAVSSSGRVAWVNSDVEFGATMGDESVEMSGRLTCVFENRDGKWLVAQWHASMPYSGQETGESWPEVG